MIEDENEKRLKRIIEIAGELGWIIPNQISDLFSTIRTEYPLMQLSEVEKCMLAMVNDYDLQRMETWYENKLKESKK